MKSLFNVASFLLVFSIWVGAQEVTRAKTNQATTIKAEAEKSSRAFMSGDYNRVLDLTYPRIVEMAGGKAKLLAEVEKEMKSIRDQGFKLVSHTVGEPEPSVRAGTKLLAVVPTALKLESAVAFFTQRSFWLAVSTDKGKSWTFIDGSALDKKTLGLVFPEAIGRIKLPARSQPLIERKASG